MNERHRPPAGGAEYARSRARRRRRERVEAELGIRDEMLEARALIRQVRWVLAVGASALLVYAIAELTGLASSGDSPSLVNGLGALVGAALVGLGFVQADRRPLPWVGTAAALCTVLVAWQLIAGKLDDERPVMVVVGLWGGFVKLSSVAARVRDLRHELDDDPFADIERARYRTRRELGEDVPVAEARQRSDERRAAAQRRGRRLNLVLAALAAACVVTALAINAHRRRWFVEDEPLAAAEARFATAWRADDLEELRAMLVESRRGDYWNKVLALLEREDWRRDLPPLGPRLEERVEMPAARITHGLPRGQLKVGWMLRDGRWVVTRYTFAGLR